MKASNPSLPPGEKKRAFVGDYCVKQHLLREVNAVSVEICLARRHFRTLRWMVLAPFSALEARFWGPSICPCLWGKETHLHRRVLREATSATSGRRRLRRNLPGTAAFLDPSLAALTAFRALAGGLARPSSVLASGIRTRTHIGKPCAKQHLLYVSSIPAEIWMVRRRHFRTSRESALTALWALDEGF